MILLLSTCLLATTGLAEQDEDFREVAERLNQMSLAMSQMTYQGTFVYVQGSLVETMRITHVVDESGIHERLVAETGPQRELWRDSRGVSWVAKDSNSVVRDPAFKRSYFPDVSPATLERSDSYYAISLENLEPLAGRLGRKLSIVPLDNYRYGYNLWLEEPSGLLLRWELYEDSARPLARLMFTDIRIGHEVDRSDLRGSESMERYQTHESDLPARQELTHATPIWSPAQLPPGFRLTSHRRQEKNAPEPFQHLVYSDGIATVSVYVDSVVEGRSPPSGASRMGTTHAYSRRADGFQITVVGDVPALTVAEIAQAVQQNTP